ncbi:N-acetylmuramoyl-L-alanine amidase [Mesobacillus jeotgali]|uniref:N-acetylmuramoyl-L-alanine amidase n=1 Tax=Mesobacillus jeotgali TaxID=129985 RepID=UPI000C83A094|nr:N-acetylmuramoyl-L-alanine amidase [Mesobacillus jeotgali]
MNKRLVLVVLSFMIFIIGGCSEGLHEEAVARADVKESEESLIIEKQIPLIKDFMPDMNFVPRSNVSTHVVLHFISNAANNPENPYEYEDIRKIFIDYDVSPHYMIDREGKIYFLMPESRAARHSGKGELSAFSEYKDHLNKYSIGIELLAVGTEAEMKSMMSADHYKKIPREHIGYTEEQYKALNLLLEDILARNKEIKRDRIHIIGHDEYAPERKTDPGSLFDWDRIMLEGE